MVYANALYLILLIAFILYRGGFKKIQQDFTRNILIWSGIVCFLYLVYMVIR